MANTGVFGKGCILKIGDGATPTEIFTEIPGARSFEFAEAGASSAERKDVTSHSTTGNLREYVDGLSDMSVGSVSFSLVFDADNTYHALLVTKHGTGADTNFKFTLKTLASTNVATFTGRVTGLTMSAPHDDIITAKVTITILSSPALSWA